MLFPHPFLERLEVEGSGLTAPQAIVNRLLQNLDRLCALLIATDEVAHVIARIAETPVLSPASTQVFIGSGSDTFIVAMRHSSIIRSPRHVMAKPVKNIDNFCHGRTWHHAS